MEVKEKEVNGEIISLVYSLSPKEPPTSIVDEVKYVAVKYICIYIEARDIIHKRRNKRETHFLITINWQL